MRLGLITDIHEQNDLLRVALQRFAREQVDQVVVIGDLLLTGEEIQETCRLLSVANAVGVWGNHDFGLCVEPDEEVAEKYGPEVIRFMTSLRPRLVIAGCHFTHVEPWLNPEEPLDLWYYEGPPDEPSKISRIFDATPNRVMFAGHYHRWLLVTPDGTDSWQGDRPIRLDQGRYYVVIGALSEGGYATFDTETSLLTPFNRL